MDNNSMNGDKSFLCMNESKETLKPLSEILITLLMCFSRMRKDVYPGNELQSVKNIGYLQHVRSLRIERYAVLMTSITIAKK